MHTQIEVFETQPQGFCARITVAACYIEITGKILLLQQGLAKQEVGAWGVPAGKLEKRETPLQAAQRELYEETGIKIEQMSTFHALGCLYIRRPEMDYVYHLFEVKLSTMPTIFLSSEHQSYRWQTIEKLDEMHLMTGAKEGIEHYQKRKTKTL